MCCDQAQGFEIGALEFAQRGEELGSGSEVEGFRVEFGHGLLVEGFTARETPQLLDHLAVGAAVGRTHPHVHARLRPFTLEVVRAARARVHLHGQQVRAAPGHDVQLRRQARSDAVADHARQPLFEIERGLDAAHVPGGVLNPDQERTTGGIGKRHQGSQRAVG